MDEARGEVLDGGKVTSVGGISMLAANARIPDMQAFAAKRPAYTDTEVERTTTWIFNAGRQVHELVAPTGSVYVMQSASRHVDPNLTVEQLATLGERLQLPDGWQYRVRTLDQDLAVRAREGVAHVVLDEFENNYQRED